MGWMSLLAAAWLGTPLIKTDVAPSLTYETGRRGRFFIEGFTGQSIIAWLGSEDPRRAHGFGIGFFAPAPRILRIKGMVPELLIEGYHHRSTSPGASGIGPNGTDAYGILTLARYTFSRTKDASWYFDIGTGFQYADMRTVDLSGRGSFTPTIGIGVSLGDGPTQFVLGARYFHISNAGLQGNNQGQNQILFTVGIRF